MSPEAEAQKVIAISLGKIAHSRIQRGGPKLCKNLLVANLIHKARTLVVDDPFQCYYPNYPQAQLFSSSNESADSASSTTLNGSSSLNSTEVQFEVDETGSSSQSYSSDDHLGPDVESFSKFSNCEDKENDSPGMDTVVVDVANPISPRLHSDSLTTKNQRIPSRCMKRRNSCVERKVDHDSDNSPKRVCDHRSVTHTRSNSLDNTTVDIGSCTPKGCPDEAYNPAVDSTELPVDSMDVEQISSLVSAFSNSFMDFCGSSFNSADCDSSTNHDKNSKGVIWRANSVDIVLCAQQASNVLKVRQQSFESSSQVVA